jgi:hypothetical protein
MSKNQFINYLHSELYIDDKMKDGGEVDNLFELVTYTVTIDTNSTSDEEYSGFDEEKAIRVFNGLGANDLPTNSINYGGFCSLYKKVDKYKFVYELDKEYDEEISDYPIVEYYDNKNYYKLVEEGENEIIEHRDIAGANDKSNNLLDEITNYYHDEYGKFKYNTIQVYADSDIEQDEPIGCIQLRIADHTENINNVDRFGRCDFYISVVVADNDVTRNRFGMSNSFDRRSNEVEILVKSIDTFDDAIDRIQEEIVNAIEYVKIHNDDNTMEKGGNIPNSNIELLAPNGNKSNLTSKQWHIVRTPEFKQWFGDWEKLAMAKIKDSAMDEVTLANISKDVSKVVDSNGEPLVCYHSTDYLGEINIFKPNPEYKYLQYGYGTYFTNDKNHAESYFEGEKLKTYQVFLNLRNPIIVNQKEKGYNKKKFLQDRDLKKQNGSIIYHPDRRKWNYYIAGNSNQIKLADGSNTTFDGDNDDIRYEDGGEIESDSKKNIEQHLSNETVDSFKQKLNNPFGKKVVINNIEYTIVDVANGFGSPDITLQDNNGHIYYTEIKTFDGRTIKKLPTKSSLIEIIKKQDEIHPKANFLLNEIHRRHREKYNNEDIKTGLEKQYAETIKHRGEKRAISNLESTLMNYIPPNVQSDYRNKVLLKKYDKIDDSNDEELKFDLNYRPIFWHLTEKEFCDYAENYEVDTRLEGTKAKMECKEFYKYAIILPLLHESAERNVFLLAVETGQLPYDKAVEIITNVGAWKETNKFVAELIRYDRDRNFNANIWLQPKNIFLSSDYFKNNFSKTKADKWYSNYINDKIYNQSQELLIKFIESGIVTYADVVKRVNESNADVHPEDFAKIKIISKKAQTRLKLKALRLMLDDERQQNKKENKSEKSLLPENEKTIVQSIINQTKEGKLFNKSSLEKLGKEHGIINQNLVKELAELSVSFMAREIASNSNISTKERYEKIVGLYKNQSNLSHRTSQSIMFQQYSTPAPIGYLAGLFCGFNKQGNYFEPSAGNGLLTTAGNPSNFIVNEIDDVRNRNLKVLGFSKVLKQDATNSFVGYEKSFDGIITNPPFGTTEGVAYGNTDIKSLEQLMCLRALDTMKDNGRGALIIGGHLEYDKAGRIKAGKNRSFFVYLYRNYNVLDVINIDGHALYSRQGTSFNVRLILIDGRKEIPNGYPLIMEEPLPVTETNSYTPVKSFETLWDRVNKSM